MVRALRGAVHPCLRDSLPEFRAHEDMVDGHFPARKVGRGWEEPT